jgi:hypothetical protein
VLLFCANAGQPSSKFFLRFPRKSADADLAGHGSSSATLIPLLPQLPPHRNLQGRPRPNRSEDDGRDEAPAVGLRFVMFASTGFRIRRERLGRRSTRIVTLSRVRPNGHDGGRNGHHSEPENRFRASRNRKRNVVLGGPIGTVQTTTGPARFAGVHRQLSAHLAQQIGCDSAVMNSPPTETSGHQWVER